MTASLMLYALSLSRPRDTPLPLRFCSIVHWFEAFLKARQQAQNYIGEIGAHMKSPRRFFIIFFLDSEYFAQRFNRPVNKNGQKKLVQFLDRLGHIFSKFSGLHLGSRGSFWLKFAPSIADQFLQLSRGCLTKKKKRNQHFGPKFTKVR